MKKNLSIFVITLIMAISQWAFASQEGSLLLTEFSIQSLGIEASGTIKVYGNESNTGITNFRIEAFGHKTILNASQLLKLHGFRANGIQLSYEKGYEELGGRTIYIVLYSGFVSGPEKKIVISLNEQGKLNITPNPYDKSKMQSKECIGKDGLPDLPQVGGCK